MCEGIREGLAKRGVGHKGQESHLGFASEEPVDGEPVDFHRMGSFGLQGLNGFCFSLKEPFATRAPSSPAERPFWPDLPNP